MRVSCLLLLTVVLSGVAVAQVNNVPVSSKSVTVSVRPGDFVAVPLALLTTTTVNVAGINGEVNYDPALLTAPQVGGTSVPGFTALGNQISPGKYRFVLYANPTSVLPRDVPVIFFNWTAGPGFVNNTSTQVSYELEAASDPNGVSFPTVAFTNSTVRTLVIRNSVTEWPIYE